MARDFFKVKKGLSLASLTEDPTTDLSDGDVYYNGSLKRLRLRQNSAWINLEAGQGFYNYVKNPDGSSGVGDITVTNATITVVSSPASLSENYIALTTTTTEGATALWDLKTPQKMHEWELMRFSMRVDTRSLTDTYKIGVWDVDAEEYVTGTDQELTLGTIYKWEATFPFDITKTYKVKWERTSGTTGTETFRTTNVTVSPELTVAGPAMTEWTSFTPTLSSDTNITGKAGYWKQVGDTMHVQVFWSYTGAGVNSDITITIPDSKTIDTSKLPSSTVPQSIFGAAFWYDGSVGHTGTIAYESSSSVNVLSDSYNGRLHHSEFTEDNTFSAIFQVPIAEWAGSVTTYANSRRVWASNSSTATTDDVTTSNFVYGPGGAALGFSTTPSGHQFYRRIDYPTPTQSTDSHMLQVSQDGVTWLNMNGGTIEVGSDVRLIDTYHYDSAASTNVGMGLAFDDDYPNSVFVVFGKYRTGDSTTWDASTATIRYRVVRSSDPSGIGTGLATATQPGAIDFYKTERFTGEPGSGAGTGGTYDFTVTRVGKQVNITGICTTGSTGTPTSAIVIRSVPDWALLNLNTTFLMCTGLITADNELIFSGINSNGNLSLLKREFTTTIANSNFDNDEEIHLNLSYTLP